MYYIVSIVYWLSQIMLQYIHLYVIVYHVFYGYYRYSMMCIEIYPLLIYGLPGIHDTYIGT